jgi:hypothetical protein
MSESPVFAWLGDALEKRTSLSRIEARGTVRLVLKDAGLEPGAVNAAQMGVVITRLLPSALERRGVSDVSVLCETLCSELRTFAKTLSLPVKDTAYDVFERMGSDSKKERR